MNRRDNPLDVMLGQLYIGRWIDGRGDGWIENERRVLFQNDYEQIMAQTMGPTIESKSWLV